MRFWSVQRAVLGVLWSELGLWGSTRVVCHVFWGKLVYRPFRNLASDSSPSEKLARSHVRDALILLAALRRNIPDAATRLFELSMAESAQVFLQQNVGNINKAKYSALSMPQKRQEITRLIDRFPNATAQVEEASMERVAFTVTRCRYVELAKIAGYPEAASAFCAGDAAFFERQSAGLKFRRDQSIAHGDANCPFELTLTEESSAKKNAKSD